jgi:hypothetical protein
MSKAWKHANPHGSILTILQKGITMNLTQIQTLYQVNPGVKALQSHQFVAGREAVILRRNGRVPTHRMSLLLSNELSPKDIASLRTKIFRTLNKKHGIESIVKIGFTGSMDGRPDNCVCFHFLLDDTRSARDLQFLFHLACQKNGLAVCTDYWIDYCPATNGTEYFDHFTEYAYGKNVILFRKGLRIQKFYEIGKWYRKPKNVLWQEAIDCMREGFDRQKKDEQFNSEQMN